MKRLPLIISACLLIVTASLFGQNAQTGDDVVAAFARAARGEPLRYVAIGGSITQAGGPGWVGDWLREQFPESDVTVVNSGMSGTGSSLGIFRIDRDVIAYQPDLVAIEYCVNDGGLVDAQAIRYIETMVVRLKSLPHPPAIIIVEAAAKEGVNLSRHRRVARHYGFAEVDMQEAVESRLKERGEEWSVLFSDSVHPNRAGHAFYAETMRDVLTPLVERARAPEAANLPPTPLPARLSESPLLLDARMVPLQGWTAPQWKTEPSVPAWWNRFFQGLLTSAEPGATLRIPVRGTTIGLFYAMRKEYGTFYANVNGGVPRHVLTNTRGGFSTANLATDLPAQEHMLTIALPAKSETDATLNGPVWLGYLLVAGETEATRERSPQGDYTAEVLRHLAFTAVPASSWQWTGPFKVTSDDGQHLVDAHTGIYTKFLPEPGDADFDIRAIEWNPITAEGAEVDLRALSGDSTPTAAYARVEIDGGEGGEVIFSITIDYYAQLWLNGENILVFDAPHPRPHFMPVRLKPGMNELFLKTTAGSAGHSFELRIATPKRVNSPN